MMFDIVLYLSSQAPCSSCREIFICLCPSCTESGAFPAGDGFPGQLLSKGCQGHGGSLCDLHLVVLLTPCTNIFPVLSIVPGLHIKITVIAIPGTNPSQVQTISRLVW